MHDAGERRGRRRDVVEAAVWRTGRMTSREHIPDDGAGRGGEIARGGDLATIDDVATGASTGRQTVDDPLLLLLHYTAKK